MRDTRPKGQGAETERITKGKRNFECGEFCVVQIAVEKNKLSALATFAKRELCAAITSVAGLVDALDAKNA
jgi:hypothetical protein